MIVTVFRCKEHGEFEMLEDIKAAYCPKCGKQMEYVGRYTE